MEANPALGISRGRGPPTPSTRGCHNVVERAKHYGGHGRRSRRATTLNTAGVKSAEAAVEEEERKAWMVVCSRGWMAAGGSTCLHLPPVNVNTKLPGWLKSITGVNGG